MQEEIEGDGVSGIRKIFSVMEKKKACRGKVYDFSMGNPKLDPLPEVKEILSRTVVENGFGYFPSLGKPEVRERIAEYYSSRYGLPFTGEDIGFSHGATGAMNLIFGSVGNEGDSIIFPTPLFGPPHKAWCPGQGKIPKRVRAEEDFSLPLQGIEDAVDGRTCAVYINPRNNPTGKMYSQDEIAQLQGICRRKGIFLIVDNVYEGMEWKGQSPSHWDYEKTIEVNSLSKKFSLAGSRIGWFVLHPEIKETGQISTQAGSVQEASGYLCPNILLNAVPELLDIPEERLKAHLKGYEKRIDAFVSGLEGIGYDIGKPDSTFYAWFRVPEGFEGDDVGRDERT